MMKKKKKRVQCLNRSMYHTTRETEEEPEGEKKNAHSQVHIERETQERLASIIACWHCI
jgi:hypothetical protein